MTKIPTYIPVESGSVYLDTIAKWIADEWSGETGDSVEAIKDKILNTHQSPSSVVAVLEDKAVGFVWLWRHKFEGESEPSLWINALYVHEAYRKQGIATSLVKQAISQSKSYEDRLFAYTDIPEFYMRMGWQVFQEENEEGHWVVLHESNN